MKIGFIGLGNVGSKLAGSLLRNKFDLTVIDLDTKLTHSFKNRGAKVLKLLTQNYQIFITTTDANAETYFTNMEQLNFIKLEECEQICFAA